MENDDQAAITMGEREMIFILACLTIYYSSPPP